MNWKPFQRYQTLIYKCDGTELVHTQIFLFFIFSHFYTIWRHIAAKIHHFLTSSLPYPDENVTMKVYAMKADNSYLSIGTKHSYPIICNNNNMVSTCCPFFSFCGQWFPKYLRIFAKILIFFLSPVSLPPTPPNQSWSYLKIYLC